MIDAAVAAAVPAGAGALAVLVVQAVGRKAEWSWSNRSSKRMDRVLLKALGKIEDELAHLTTAIGDLSEFRLSIERRVAVLEATDALWFPTPGPDDLANPERPTVFNAVRKLNHLQTDVTTLTNEVVELKQVVLERRKEPRP